MTGWHLSSGAISLSEARLYKEAGGSDRLELHSREETVWLMSVTVKECSRRQ